MKKGILIGCGGLLGLFGILLIAGLIWIVNSPEGGVRLANEMEEYASTYLSEHAILDESDTLVAYYDSTISLDGTEAYILTEQRLIHHYRGSNTDVAVAKIEDIKHHKEMLIGEIIEIYSSDQVPMKIEIAPMNGAETFINVLMKTWEKAKGS